MATTVIKNPATDWVAVATAGDVTITSLGQYGAYWAITNDTAGPTPVAPTIVEGHRAPPNTDVSMTLTGAERLWFKSPDKLAATAAAPA